ncbi:hypothetical protein DRO42_04265 [Candidatus Bathyarchaeota archaeon]|nr:MAG: hypothetical protein DRO42_04265 [Candidatus Bathyarchaeota archaeon]
MRELKGVMSLIPTPMTEEALDEEGVRALVDYCMENGCHGVGCAAAIGEGYLMPHGTWRRLVETTIDQMRGRGPVLVGCAAMGTAQAVELCREAEELGGRRRPRLQARRVRSLQRCSALQPLREHDRRR